MTKAPIGLQDLRKRIYIKAKAEPEWQFWGLYVHVCKLETLQEAYLMAKKNDGAPGIDGVTFAAIEQSGVGEFLLQIRDELVEFRCRCEIAQASNLRQPSSSRGDAGESPGIVGGAACEFHLIKGTCDKHRGTRGRPNLCFLSAPHPIFVRFLSAPQHDSTPFSPIHHD
jgi:hypothetical protein